MSAKTYLTHWGLGVTLSLFTLAGHACVWHPDDPFKQRRTFSYTGPGRLDIPTSTAAGLLYKEEYASYYSKVMVRCSPRLQSGFRLNPMLGPQPARGEDFPIKGTGLSLRVKLMNYFNIATISSPGDNWWLQQGATFSFSNRWEISLYKNGSENEGAVIPAGDLGSWVSLDGFEVARFVLTSPVTIEAASCKTPNINVPMGNDYQLADLQRPEANSREVSFDINLNDCPTGIKTVDYLIKANTEVIDRDAGVVALNSSSSAKGINLQIKDAKGTPVTLDTYHRFTDYDTQGGNLKIPFSASYRRAQGGTPQPGTANTEVTFIMRYL